jgi:hypothetical protein
MTEGKDELHDEIKAAYRAGAEDMLRDWAEVCECAPLPIHAGIGETSHTYWNDNRDRIISALRAPVVDEGIVERVARAMKPELFEGGPDSDRAPTVVYERNFCRQMARAALQEIQPILERVRERCAAWHDAQAANARLRYEALDRYSDDAEEREGWRSWKDANDRHRSYAAAIRQVDVLPLGEEEGG